MKRNTATPEGQAIGEMLARLCDDAEPLARLRLPELPPRCQSCAFRLGRHVANGSPETQMDAMKCVCLRAASFTAISPTEMGISVPVGRC